MNDYRLFSFFVATIAGLSSLGDQTMNTQQAAPRQFSQEKDEGNNKDTFLRRALLGNGTFSAISGTFFLVEAGGVARFSGIEPPIIFQIVGVGLVGFAAFLFWLSAQTVLDQKEVKMIIGADLFWVVGSALLLLSNWLPLTSGGWWGVAIIADIVAALAVLQYIGLRRVER